jgi:RNA polymerase sigma-70 factor (ECF subfamily)
MRTTPFQTLDNKYSIKPEQHAGNTIWVGRDISRVAELSSDLPQTRKELPLDQLLHLCFQLHQDGLWTEFVSRTHPVIAGVVMKTARRWKRPTPSLIDDLVQETYLKLCLNDFRALRQFVFQHENALFGFLKVISSNVVQDHFRGVYSQKRGSGMADADFDCATLASVLTCYSAVERGILLQAIDSCLDSYAGNPNVARDRLIFRLYYRNGLTAKAISALPSIKLSVKGVESALGRLIRFVRLRLMARKNGS